MCDLEAEEPRRVRRGLLDYHGHALDLHPLLEALDEARAEILVADYIAGWKTRTTEFPCRPRRGSDRKLADICFREYFFTASAWES